MSSDLARWAYSISANWETHTPVTTVQAGTQPRKDNGRTLAAVLLAAMVAALMVIADQLINTWADGHLMVVWVLLWAVGFVGAALLAPATRRAARKLLATIDSRAKAIARRRADERLWAVALQDPRIMADIQAARTRAEN